MFGIGLGEILILVVIIFLVNGPDRLPELARKIGKYARDFKKITDDVKQTVEREVNRTDDEVKTVAKKILPTPFEDEKTVIEKKE